LGEGDRGGIETGLIGDIERAEMDEDFSGVDFTVGKSGSGEGSENAGKNLEGSVCVKVTFIHIALESIT
jgi:hypothetical protein